METLKIDFKMCKEEKMMRKVRIMSIAIFIVAVVSFSVYKFNGWRNRDHVAPVITMDEDTITVLASAREEELLSGVTAEDEKDGDVSNSLIIENMSNFIEKGRRNITIAAFDSDNHVTKVSREVVYSDYHSPRFTLENALRFPKNTDTILDGVNVEDVLDGNLTSNIKISSDYYVQVDEVGEYPMVFTVTNSAGDVAELPITVEIYDTQEELRKPQILLSEYIVYTTIGKTIRPWDYVEKIIVNNKEFLRGEDDILRDLEPSEGQERTSIQKSEVDILQEIDYEVPGVYEVLFRFTTEDKETGSVRLIVVVSE